MRGRFGLPPESSFGDLQVAKRACVLLKHYGQQAFASPGRLTALAPRRLPEPNPGPHGPDRCGRERSSRCACGPSIATF